MARPFHFPSRQSISLGEKWQNTIRMQLLRNGQASLEASLSYPIPGKNQIFFFHYLNNRTEKTRSIISRITADFPTLEITAFEKANGKPLFPGLPTSIMANPKNFNPLLEQLFLESYDSIMERYPHENAGTLGQQWLEAFEALVPEELLPYYEALNPSFFSWCRGS